MPERDAPRLLATAYREAKQAAIAGLGVGKFGRRRPFPVDRLGLLPAHAPAPGGQFQRILRQGQMAIAPGLARPDGTSVAGTRRALGWQKHSVRGLLAGAVKKMAGAIPVSETGDTGPRRYRIEADGA